MLNQFSKSRDMLIDYKVYIAGEYAPAKDVSLQQGIFSLSEASISLFANQNIMDLGEGDRVPVQIFYLDTFDPDGSEYKIMFEGEVASVGYMRSSGDVSIQISAVSHFEILAQLFKKLFRSFEDMVGNNDAAGSPSVLSKEFNLSSLLGDELISNVADIDISGKAFSTLLSKSNMTSRFGKAKGGPNSYMRRPFVLLRNILFDIINGAALNDKTGSDVQLFLRSFISKRNIYRTIFASPILEDKSYSTNTSPAGTANLILNSINSDMTVKTILNGLSKLQNMTGGQTDFSYWSLIQQVYSVIMYEVLQPLCPPFLKADVFGVPQETGVPAYSGMMHVLSKPTINFGIPPISNTIFPCMIHNISYHNDHLSAPTRCFVGNSGDIMNKLGASAGTGQSVIRNIVLNHTSTIVPRELSTLLKNNSHLLNKKLLWDTTKGDYRFNAEFFKGPVFMSVPQIPTWIDYAKRQLTTTVYKRAKEVGKTTVTKEESDLGTQLENVIETYSSNLFEVEQSSRKTVTITMKFNPYIMIGFPAAIIDNLDFRAYFLAMPVQIQHTLSNGGAQTTVSFTNIISFPDAYVYQNTEDGFDVGPRHVSLQVAEVFNQYSGTQTNYITGDPTDPVITTGANFYYKQLLYQNFERTNKQYCFNPDDYFYINKDDKTKKYVTGYIDTGITAEGQGTRPGVLEGKDDLLDDFESAMRWVFRPIASMADYLETRKDIVFMNKNGEATTHKYEEGQPLTAGLVDIQDRKFFNEDSSTADVVGRKVGTKIRDGVTLYRNVPVYYERLVSYSYLTDNLNDSSPITYNTEFTANKPTDVTEMPDFIRNWARLVRAYREDVKNIYRDFYIG